MLHSNGRLNIISSSRSSTMLVRPFSDWKKNRLGPSEKSQHIFQVGSHLPGAYLYFYFGSLSLSPIRRVCRLDRRSLVAVPHRRQINYTTRCWCASGPSMAPISLAGPSSSSSSCPASFSFFPFYLCRVCQPSAVKSKGNCLNIYAQHYTLSSAQLCPPKPHITCACV